MNKKWIRTLAVLLAVVCLMGTVAATTAASTKPGDLDGDGRITAYDAQLMAEYQASKVGAGQLTATLGLSELSFGDIWSMVTGTYAPEAVDSVYQIDSLADLWYMADHPDKDYKLQKSLDLGGADWKPVNFTGNLDGNGYAVSNVTITKVGGSSNNYMGFFANIGANSTVKNLDLENVNITAAKGASYIGLLTGSMLGKVENCTTTGTVADNRTNLTSTVYVGTICGRIANNNDAGWYGSITMDDSSQDLVATYADNDGYAYPGTVPQGLTSRMAADYAQSGKHKTGIYGYKPEGAEVTADLKWQDTTGSLYRASETLTARRDTVVDYMYQMATTSWKAEQNMHYLAYYSTSEDPRNEKKFTSGTTYEGIPYGHGSSSLERFQYAMANQSALLDPYGLYLANTTVNTAIVNPTTADKLINHPTLLNTIVPGITKETIDTTDLRVTDQAGFSRWIGNDCSTAITQAWWKVSSATPGNGGVSAYGVSEMMPTASNATNYGIQGVGGIQATKNTSAEYKTDYKTLGQKVYLEAYAKAGKGDALAGMGASDAHSRMIAYDPMVLRDAAGSIYKYDSYIITVEHGGTRSGEANATTWGINRIYTFDQLSNCWTDANQTADRTDIGTACAYMPITIDALNNENSAAAQGSTLTVDDTGVLSASAHIISTTVDGKVVYTGVAQHRADYRKIYTSLDLSAVHGNYAGTATVLLADGSVWTVADGQATKN